MDFSSPLLRDVALELKKRGVDIVYWTGSNAVESFKQDKENFGSVIFHNIINIIKGIPPKEINPEKFLPPGKKLLDNLLKCESQVLSMMDRVDLSNLSVNQKKHLYCGYVKYWYGVLDKFKPDAILYPAVPHRIYNYIVYYIANKAGIKNIFFQKSSLDALIVVNDYEEGSKKIIFDLKNDTKNFKIGDLSPRVQEYYKNQLDPNVDSKPAYCIKSLKKRGNMPLPKLGGILKSIANLSFLSKAWFWLNVLFKKRQMIVLDKDFSGFRFKMNLLKWDKMVKKYKKEYLELETRADFSKKFVYVPLHLQPESSTSPLGDIFINQILMIDILANSLPKDWVLYVKEHLPQWRLGDYRSHLGRYEKYYEKIAKIKNTYLIPPTISTFDLIEKSQAVATVTGTAGWEAVLRSKPAIIFGYPWYKNCAGVFSVDDVESCKRAFDKIANGYKPTPPQIINFLAILEKNSIEAYYQYKHSQLFDISYEENIRRLADAYHKEFV